MAEIGTMIFCDFAKQPPWLFAVRSAWADVLMADPWMLSRTDGVAVGVAGGMDPLVSELRPTITDSLRPNGWFEG